MPRYEKIIVVTKKTALEELVERFNTLEQTRFYIEHMGASFAEYQAAHDAYKAALAKLKEAIPDGVRAQFIEREFLPSFSFGDEDLVATLGPDGLVVNTAKYLSAQPLLAFNPDAARIDGILLPFPIESARPVLSYAVQGNIFARKISMARADLNDGQSLHAVNDFFIGPRSHVSAHYILRFGKQSEAQSSSGLIVSTGAGSTGWLRSVVTGAAGIMESLSPAEAGPIPVESCRFDWEANQLIFSVREPFPSRTSQTNLVFGRIEAGQTLEIVSQMPQKGVIFSDGIEEDFMEFNSGTVARITLAQKKLNLVVGAA